MNDWSALPYDILGAIVLKLDAIKDRVWFSAVCRSWKCAFLQVKHLSQPKTPWLMLAESTEENPECLRKLFDLHTNTCVELKLPETIGRRCWGSNYGWIVTVGLDREMHVFNPFTKARLCLPSSLALPIQTYQEGQPLDYERLRRSFVKRAIVLRIHEVEDEDEDEEFLVMVVYGDWRYLAFAKPGDQVWTPIAGVYDKETKGVDDVCYYNGKIFAIFLNGALGWCDLNSPDLEVIDYLPPPPKVVEEDLLGYICKLYLVNLFGDLLIVIRFKEEVPDENDPDHEDKDICYQTEYCSIFRPDIHTKEWVEIHDLGDVALFVGDNSSTWVFASNAHNCRRNHVYFTDDESQFWRWPREKGGHDMGAYDIENDEIVPYYKGGNFRSGFCTPFWFTPKF